MSNSIISYTLNNGLKVLIKEIPNRNLVLILPWMNVGSVNETDDMAGVSHFIEHLLFKGTDKRDKGQLAEEIESIGGILNAFTSYWFTAYYVLVPTENFSKALDIQFDQLTNPIFPQEEIERERQVVLEEIRLYNDMPIHKVVENLHTAAFRRHRHGRPVIGSKEVIENIDRNRIVDHYSNYYKPNNCTLIICGDIKADNVRGNIEKIYGSWQKGEVKINSSPSEPFQPDFSLNSYKMEINENFVAFGVKIPEFLHPDIIVLDVLRYLIVDCGESSILVNSLKNKRRLVSSLESDIFYAKEKGLLSFYGSQSISKSPKDLLTSAFEEIENLKQNGIEPSDLEKSKNHLLRRFVSEIEDISNYGMKLGEYNCYGDYKFIEEYADRIKNITADDVQEILVKYFTVNNLSVSELLPKSSKQMIDKKDLKQKFLTFQKSDPKLLVRDFGNYKLILENRHHIPKVGAVVLFRCGSAYENTENNGISALMLETLLSGTESLAYDEIANKLEHMGTYVHKQFGKEYCFLWLEMLPRYFKPSMEILLDCVLNPAFPENEIEKQKENLITNLHMVEDHVMAFSQIFFERVYFGRHPYGLCQYGEKNAIGNITQEELKDWHKKFITGGNIIISIVGDATEKEAFFLANKYLGSIQKNTLPTIPKFDSAVRGTFGEEFREREQSHLILGGEIPPYGHNKPEFDIISEILGGMSGRLFKRLRDEKSLAYAVYPYTKRFSDAGIFCTYIGTKIDQEGIAKLEIAAELENFVRKFKNDEFNKAKAMCITEHLNSMQRFAYAALRYGIHESYGFDAKEICKYPDKIKDISESKLYEIIKKFIKHKDLTLAVIHGKNSG
ncbi:MAG: insulinase family protein [Methanocellales archaeon]|nr:insulinase family protein [Methanocellales archaeon]